MPDVDSHSRDALENAVSLAPTNDVVETLERAERDHATYGWEVTFEEFTDILRWELLSRRGECPT